MANELKHGDPGTSMTQAEFIATDLHVLNSQATGDLIYASSATQLSRLGIGSTNAFLQVVAGVPSWVLAPTLGGTLTINGQVFNAGAGNCQINSTGAYGGLTIQTTQDTSFGVFVVTKHISASPAQNDAILIWQGNGKNDAAQDVVYCDMRMEIEAVTDGTEAGRFAWYPKTGGGENLAMTLSGAGALWIDSSLTIGAIGCILPASGKIYPVSGVAGFSVVSTALTLGSLGSVLIPQSAADCTDALAGNIDGCIGIDSTEDGEQFWFRANAEWYYIAKTGGLSMTKEERISPEGHKFQIGDKVELVVDRINPDGSFHALPHYAGVN